MQRNHCTRRDILRGALGASASIVLGAPAARLAAQSTATPPAQAFGSGAVVQLATDLFVITLPGEANVVAHLTPNGVMLVDGGSAQSADALSRIVAGLPGAGPIHTLFNTHWHPEQTGLNERVGQAGRPIIAHENTRLWLTTDVTWSWNGRQVRRLPKVAQPNRTFYTSGALDSGIRYGYLPDAAHTDGDMYVFFPRQNVLVVGDVVSNQGWPVVDWATGGWIGGLAGGLQRLQTLVTADTRIVPGRGPVMGVTELEAQARMYTTIYGRLTTLLNSGRSPTEAVETRPTSEFDAQMGNPDEFVRRAFESLWAYLSPDA